MNANMINPFTISFGKQPSRLITRLVESNEIIDNFNQDPPSNQVYMITGVRGSGKTVMMTSCAKTLEAQGGFIVIELSPERDLLNSLAAKLNARPELYSLYIKAKLNFSVLGLGVTVESGVPISDVETAISRMLDVVKASNRRLLITIDEAVNNENVRAFASVFQILMRQDYPVFLLMTGLYDNIYNLQNVKTLTFLYRAPKIPLGPLNITAIKKNYADIFGLSMPDAGRMADLTKGYPFAFQVLGYLYWNQRNEKSLEDILPEYDQYLEDYVYSKIWLELSGTDRKVLLAMASTGHTKVIDIRNDLEMTSSGFSVYRDRLNRKGIISMVSYGHVDFTLPRFDEFVKAKSD